jgi:hypothetical protein
VPIPASAVVNPELWIFLTFPQSSDDHRRRVRKPAWRGLPAAWLPANPGSWPRVVRMVTGTAMQRLWSDGWGVCR